MELDIKDKKILYELDFNSRETLKNIGKKIRLSQQAIENRINNMIKNNIINSFQTIIAYHKLRYTTYILYLNFQNTTLQKEKEIINKLKLNNNIIAIWKCEGIYDLLLAIQSKNIFELNNIINKINNQFGEFIRNYDIVTNVGAEHYTRDYLLNKKRIKKKLLITGGQEKIIKLDKKDSLILKELIKNPRINFVNLAKKLNLTIDIVRYRFKKLKENKIIQGFSVILNHRNFNYINSRILFKLKNITEDIRKEIFNFTSMNSNIKMATKSFGVYELALDIETETNEQLREILSKFRNKFNEYIHHYEILNVYSIEKYITYLIL